MIEMFLRLTVALVFGASAVLSFYAYREQRRPHLLGIAIWCSHVVLFTMVAALKVVGIFYIESELLNIWSNTVRLHGGIMVFSISLYYLSRRSIT